MNFETVSAADRVRQLQSDGLREFQIILAMQQAGYNVSRRFVRDTLGVSTEQRTQSVAQPAIAPHKPPQRATDDVVMLDSPRPTWMPSDEFVRGMIDDWRGALDAPAPSNPCPLPIDVTGGKPNPFQIDTWMCFADPHTPFHSVQTLERGCRVATKNRVRNLVIPGDFFDNDAYSRHGDDIAQVDVNEAIKRSGQVLYWLLDTFDTIYMLPGNHCRRFAKRINKNLSFRNLVLMSIAEYGIADRIKTVEDDYFFIGNEDTGQSPDEIGWVVGHPSFYSKQATAGYDTLALLKRRHVMGAHRHTFGVTRYHNRYLCVDPGTTCDAWLFPYLKRGYGMARHADQSNGFALVHGGRVQVFADGVGEWNAYGTA